MRVGMCICCWACRYVCSMYVVDLYVQNSAHSLGPKNDSKQPTAVLATADSNLHNNGSTEH